MDISIRDAPESYAKWFIGNIAFSLTLSVILHLLAMDTGPRWPYLMRPKLINSGDDKNFSELRRRETFALLSINEPFT